MHKEYAVEPTAIGQNWETFRYLIEKFGFSEGRLISRFPSSWARLVMEAADAAQVPPVDRKRIEEKLRQKKDLVLIKSGRNYDPDLPTWFENALNSHAERAFHAVVTQGEQQGNEVLCVQDIDDGHPLVAVPRTADIPRTAEALCDACSILFQSAREVDIVDPYLFKIENSNSGYRETVRRFLAFIASHDNSNLTVRLHYGNANGCPPEAHVIQNCGNWFRGLIPASITVHFLAWNERPGGEDFHDRFVLTDRGGLQVGSGLAAVGPQEHALIALLDTGHSQSIRARFSDTGNVYSQYGRTVVIPSTGAARLL